MGEAVYDYDNYHRGALFHSALFGRSHLFCRPTPQSILQPRDLRIISQLSTGKSLLSFFFCIETYTSKFHEVIEN